ncbi:MAG TPA: uroporphyrinogen decarboxylase family protein [Phycisphaerae bacterium]|nr:uroporphyrinogen decarboxylase family protein [Phycisphaerae bacterium]
MKRYPALERTSAPNWEGLIANLRRQGTPDRAYHLELFQDTEIADAIADRYDLLADLDPSDPYYAQRREMAIQRFCGFDYVCARLGGMDWALRWQTVPDTAHLAHDGGRGFIDEHRGPIASWDDFEAYPWPDPAVPAATRELEWYEANLPDDMCVLARDVGHFAELLCWLMGYETLCYSLYDAPDLVEAIAARLLETDRVQTSRLLEFDRVKAVFASDDMGFKTGLLISPDDTRRLGLANHKVLAAMAHAAGRPYLLHSCGNLRDIIDDLLDDVRIDAKHSFEDTIEDVCEVKATYGQRIALLGGIDVDFLCRSTEAAIRQRVRRTLDVCQPGGGYCLGTGNSVANYVPLENYLAMLDEGWLYGQ